MFANHVFILSTLLDDPHFPVTLLAKMQVKGGVRAV